MDKAVDESFDLMQLAVWFDKNRQRVITIAVAILVVAAVIGFYYWHKDSRETAANVALSNVKPPPPSRTGEPIPMDPQPYLTVADEYSGTSAASRALLLAGGAYFDSGSFDKAQAQFSRFLSEYPDSLLANQAALGIAASLEAQGKASEAISRYTDLINRHPNTSIIPQAKSALARLYVTENKPEQAVPLYEDLARGGNNDTWSAEASIQLEELLAKYPQLRKQAPAPAPAPTQTAPTLTIPPSTQKTPAPVPNQTAPNHPGTAPVVIPPRASPSPATNK